MSKTKSGSVPKEATASKSNVLSKVKGSSVTKPAQTVKAKSKDIAKQVVAKEDKKKSKKVPVKEPTPEPSSDEEADSSDEDESEDEVEKKTPAVNGKAKEVKTVKKDESSDEEDDSEESASEDEAPKKTGAAAKPVATATEDADSDDASSDESDDEKTPQAIKAVAAAKPDEESSDESASDEEDDDASSANASDSDDNEDSDSEDEVETKTKSTKRKAEDDNVPAAKKSKVDEAAATTSPNLFVGNLSWNVDEDWLRQEFEEFGELSGVRLMTDRQTGRSKGFGYVEFVNAADAAKAHAAKQGAELDGRALNVDFANPKQSNGDRQDNRRKSYGDQVGEASDTLFLGNLSFECTNEDITSAFSPHGTVMSVRLPTDRETGAPKGFGYVTFSSIEEATGALEAMQGGYIARRAVRLDYSQPRQNTGDSPRGGFGGRGGGRGGFGGRGRGGGRGDFGGRGGGGRGGRGGRGGSTNRGGFGDFSGRKTTF